MCIFLSFSVSGWFVVCVLSNFFRGIGIVTVFILFYLYIIFGFWWELF